MSGATPQSTKTHGGTQGYITSHGPVGGHHRTPVAGHGKAMAAAHGGTGGVHGSISAHGGHSGLMNMPQLTVEEALMNLEGADLMNLEGAALMNMEGAALMNMPQSTSQHHLDLYNKAFPHSHVDLYNKVLLLI